MASLIFDLEDWVPAAQRMIEVFSRVWGGHGDILVPASEDGTISGDLWRLLERFDPDRLGYYAPTQRGRQMADPELFERWLNRRAEQRAQEESDISYEDARKQLLESDLMTWPLTNWSPPESLNERVRRFLAPLDVDHPFDQVWVADGAPGHHLLDVNNTREIEGPPIFCLRAQGVDARLDLMLINRFGAVSPSFEDVLQSRGIGVVHAEAKLEHLAYVLDACWAEDPERRLADERMFREVLGDEAELPWDPGQLQRTPFRITEIGCGWYVVGRPWRHELPYLVVTGDTAQDYCFAMALERMYGNATWVPFEFLSGEDELSLGVRSHLAHHLNRVSGYGYGQVRPVRVTSVSLDRQSFESIAEGIWSLATTTDLATRVPWIAPEDVALPKPMRLYDPDQILRQRWEPFIDGDLAGVLDTPRPSRVSEVNPMDFTWHIDVAIDDIRIPPRARLNDLMAALGPTERESVRASSDGISYFSREPFFIPAGATVEQSTYRPRVRLPNATDIFQRLLDTAGLRGVISQAGRFSQGAIELWGGLSEFAADLADKQRLALLEAYLSKSPSGVDPGVYLGALRRRFLSVWDVRRATGMSTEGARALLDEYVERGVLTRGLCLKCPRCNYAGWYGSEDLGQRFTCPRCRAESWIAQSAWLQPRGEPLWFYQLDEIAFQALDQNVRAPVLALELLRGESRGFIFSPEMDVFENSTRLAEADLWVVAEAAIIIGEAKTTDRLADHEEEERQVVRRLVRVAEAVTAHELLLATTEPAWSARTRRMVDEALSATAIRARFLQGVGAES